MDFVKFVDLTRPIIGGKSGIHTYVKTLFDAILTDNGKDILNDYKDSTYKAYANGSTSINKISKAMVSYIDPVEFSSFIFDTEESVQLALCQQFKVYLPNININNVGDEIAELFTNIIREAASIKRKSPKSKKDTGTKKVLKDETENNNVAQSEKPKLVVKDLNEQDTEYLKQFREVAKPILIYCIENDPSAGATDLFLSDRINDLINYWKFKYHEIEDLAFRILVKDTMDILEEYTYYLSDQFLRLIPRKNILWFRNESREESERLKNILRPETIKKRYKMQEIYLRLYPVSENQETIVVQHQTNVIQNGKNNVNLTNNGTMNIKM